MKLYEIAELMREILSTLAEPEPDPDAPEYAIVMAERELARDALEQTGLDMKAKLHAYVALAQELRAEREARELEIERIEATVLERMRAQCKRDAAKEQWLMDTAAQAIRQFEVPLPIKYLEFTLSRRKLPPSVRVVDPRAVPEEYQRIVPELHEPDKKKILADLKDGVVIPGVELAEGGYALTVR